jgi:hypothetical protein
MSKGKKQPADARTCVRIAMYTRRHLRGRAEPTQWAIHRWRWIRPEGLVDFIDNEQNLMALLGYETRFSVSLGWATEIWRAKPTRRRG